MKTTGTPPWQNAAHRLYSAGNDDLPVRIVPATPADADMLTAIAFAAKRYWDYPLRWLELWRDDLTIRPECIAGQAQAAGAPSSRHYIAQVCGKAVGFYALVCTDRQAALEHLWVRPEAMGRGVGRALFQHAVQQAKALGAATLGITADPNAEGFYVRMGAYRVGEKIYQLEGQNRVLPLLTYVIA